MYADVQPCSTCGSPVHLEPRTGRPDESRGPVGPPDGVVGGADSTPDERVCTNVDCPTRGGAGDA